MSLEKLSSDEFLDRYAGVSTGESLYEVLQKSDAVKETRKQIVEGAISRETVEAFVELTMRDFRPGQVLRGDVTLAALAVAIERIQPNWAGKYLSSLAGLTISELPLSRRVAARVVRESAKYIAASTVGTEMKISRGIPRTLSMESRNSAVQNVCNTAVSMARVA